MIIPGGALSDKNDQWLSSRQDLFVHTKPFEIIFKAKFKAAMKKAGLLHKIDPAVWQQQWVIDSQAVGQGQNSLRYLSRYVFRVAISNNRIKSRENGVIKFEYKDREKKKWKIMALDAGPKRGRKPKSPDDVKIKKNANITDPESRIMKNRSGFVQAYNC